MDRHDGIILVTGSSGLIGKAIINRLADRYHIVGLDRKGPPYPPPAADCVDIDLTSDDSVNKAMEHVRSKYGKKIASVIHLAAYYDFSGEPSPLYEKVTVEGSRRMLEALKPFEVEQFIFSSTMLIHKPQPRGTKIKEDSPIKAGWPYPQSKVETELLLKKSHGKIPLVLARIAGVYDDECHSIPIAHQIRRIYENDITSYVFPGDAGNGQPFVHLDDVVDALELMVQQRKGLPREWPVLIGEPETMSYGELQDTFCRLLHGKTCKTHRIPKVVAKAGALLQNVLPIGDDFIKPWMVDRADDHYELDISQAVEVLGWKPKRRLKEHLSKIVMSLKNNPERWYREQGLKGAPPKKTGTPAGTPS